MNQAMEVKGHCDSVVGSQRETAIKQLRLCGDKLSQTYQPLEPYPGKLCI